MRRALDGSLRRLRTDHVDLYQLHWPNRRSYNFRRNWGFDPSGQDRCETIAHMEDVLGQLQREVEAGRIRHVGLSNETAWGMMTWRRIAEARGFPMMQTIQNEYSLLARLFDTDLAEVAAFEGIGLLAYSPLGAGLLTGKYRGGVVPAGSRMAINGDLGGRATERAHPAVEAYAAVAMKHGLEPVPMALAFCRSRPFMTSAIFGATSTDHVALALKAADLELPQEVLDDLNVVHKAHPLPY